MFLFLGNAVNVIQKTKAKRKIANKELKIEDESKAVESGAESGAGSGAELGVELGVELGAPKSELN